MTLFHGSLYEIKNPQFNSGNPFNDYGTGFYCTENIELAKEWGCADKQNGFANEYSFDDTGLSILNLSEPEYSILNWLAILLENRVFELRHEIAKSAKNYIMSNFLIDYSSYDIIRGYRADDSYFSFANAFLNNSISLSKLNTAMHLGKLGEQIVLKSDKSFSKIQFLKSHISDYTVYYPKKILRDQTARNDFYKIRKSENSFLDKSELFIIDLIRNEVKSNDTSLQQALLR